MNSVITVLIVSMGGNWIFQWRGKKQGKEKALA